MQRLRTVVVHVEMMNPDWLPGAGLMPGPATCRWADHTQVVDIRLPEKDRK